VETRDPAELFSAIEANDVERIRSLIEAAPELAAAVNAEGVSAVLLARYRSQPDTVETLRAARPELPAADGRRCTPRRCRGIASL